MSKLESKKGAGAAGSSNLAGAKLPAGERPWRDENLSAEQRFESYKELLREQSRDYLAALPKATGSQLQQIKEEVSELRNEINRITALTAQEFVDTQPLCLEAVAKELGKNFLGAAQWKEAFGVEVGAVPPIPNSITKELLISDCPIEPGKKIKETHILVLIPESVDGKPYSALKLDELCSTTKGSGDKLIDDGIDSWKGQSWASTEQAASEWVLIPKRDPDSAKVSPDKHFRSKDIAAQDKVHEKYYKEYPEVKTLEVMTMALLYDLTHKKRLLPDWLRCEEPNASGGRVCVGFFDARGLQVLDGFGDSGSGRIGRALARKLKT
jgi:hypothetical protein